MNQIDINSFPLVKINIVKITNKTECDNFLNNFNNLFKICQERNSKMILIFDALNLIDISMDTVSKVANYMKKNEKLEIMYINESYILTSNLGSTLLNILFDIKKPLCPYFICTSYKKVNLLLNKKYQNYNQSSN